MFHREILLCCLLLLALASCKKESPTVIVDIEDDFYIDMFEDISNNGQRFQLNVSTIKEQNCLNFQISHNLSFDEQSNAIAVTINELIEPSNCETGNTSTSLTIPFGPLSPGNYTLDVNLKDAVINQGQLDVYSDRYELNMYSHDGIEIRHETLYRIPQGTVWGYVAYDEANDAFDASDFLFNLENSGLTFSIQNNSLFKAGYYGYFDLNEDKNLLVPGEINYNNHTTFIYQHTTDSLDDIIQMKEETCASTNLEIKLFTSTGLELNCD